MNGVLPINARTYIIDIIFSFRVRKWIEKLAVTLLFLMGYFSKLMLIFRPFFSSALILHFAKWTKNSLNFQALLVADCVKTKKWKWNCKKKTVRSILCSDPFSCCFAIDSAGTSARARTDAVNRSTWRKPLFQSSWQQFNMIVQFILFAQFDTSETTFSNQIT